ncbi:MAG: hypothetical protein HC842_09200 [Cytophagales bacterium]|nr:hypothetical protein [Cytophagales bacterium]
MFAPLIWAYVRALAERPLAWQRKNLIHLLPALLALLGALGVWALPASYKNELLQTYLARGDVYSTSFIGSVCLVYFVLAWREARCYEKNQGTHPTALHTLNRGWIRFFLWSCMLIVLVVIPVYDLSERLFPRFPFAIGLLVTPAFALIFYYVVFFKSFAYHRAYQGMAKAALRGRAATKGELPAQQMARLSAIKQNLDKLLNDASVYADPKMTLEKWLSASAPVNFCCRKP